MDSNSIVWLDRNENQYGPSPECLKVLADSGTILLSDYSRDYLNGIKSPLSARLAADYGLSESNVILGYGGEDLLKQAIHCYVHEGGRIMIPSHSWWYYKKISDEVGGIKVEYPIVEGNDTFTYDIRKIFTLPMASILAFAASIAACCAGMFSFSDFSRMLRQVS